jgi:ATP-dependent protease ClpP protease subunit
MLLLILLSCVFSDIAYSEEILLTEKNSISLIGNVDEYSIEPIQNKIDELDENEQLYIFIDSPGGSVFAALGLVEELKTTNKKITCIARKAISMAFSIFQACPVRLITPMPVLMQHRMGLGVQGSPDELKSRANAGFGLEYMLNSSDAARLQLTVEEFSEKIRYEWWIVGSEAVLKAKAADKIVTIKRPKKVKEQKEEVKILKL